MAALPKQPVDPRKPAAAPLRFLQKAAPWCMAAQPKGNYAAMTVGVKWHLAVVNFGAPRHDGEEIYTQNIYNVPAWVVLCCELWPAAHERILNKRDEWRPAESALHLQAPPQGFEPDGLVRSRMSCGLEEGLTALARPVH